MLSQPPVFFPIERGHLCRGKCYRHRNFRSFVLSEPNSNFYGLHIKLFFILKAVIPETNEYVAIKRVFQDKRYKNREHSIMKEINHTNCVRLLTSFFSNDEEKVSFFFLIFRFLFIYLILNPKKPDDVYLNLVMDYVPSDLYKILKYFRKQKQIMPDALVKLYSYQMLRGLAYIHSIGICHRDIKPQNVLVDPEGHIVKLCDFGSAKKLQKGEIS